MKDDKRYISTNRTPFFAIREDRKIIHCIRVGNHFFINWGAKIVISPMNRIKRVKIDIKKEIAYFYYDLETLDEIGYIALPYNDRHFSFKQFADDFMLTAKTDKENYGKIRFTLNPFKGIFKYIVQIDASELLKNKIKFKKGIAVITIHYDINEIRLIPIKEGNWLSKLKGYSEYTRYKGEVFPIYNYKISFNEKANKVLAYVLENLAKDYE